MYRHKVKMVTETLTASGVLEVVGQKVMSDGHVPIPR
jgi:hypothetical protein